MLSKDEQKNRRIGVAVSITIHTLLVLLLFIINAWKAPDPPLPEYGIELNFGITDAGSGDIQPQSEEISEIPPSEVQEIVEELIEEESPEEVMEEVTETPPLQNESSDVIHQKTDSKTKTDTKLVEKKVVKEPTPKQSINNDAVMGPQTSTNPNESTSHGDRSVAGDQGSKEGAADKRSLYGNQGGGDNGPVFNLKHWKWNEMPIEKDPSPVSGFIIFKIKVNKYGVVSVVTIDKTTVPLNVANFYRSQVYEFTFKFDEGAGNPPSESTGTLTLTINQN
jgi:hypothetical protein